MVLKFDTAKETYEKAMKKKMEKEAQDKVEAYNAWRIEEEKKGRAQDEHGRSLVKTMLDYAKSGSPLVTQSMCNVMGNVDGNYIYNFFFTKKYDKSIL